MDDATDHLFAAEAPPLHGRKRDRKKLSDLLVRHTVEKVETQNFGIFGWNPVERRTKDLVPLHLLSRSADDVGKHREARRIERNGFCAAMALRSSKTERPEPSDGGEPTRKLRSVPDHRQSEECQQECVLDDVFREIRTDNERGRPQGNRMIASDEDIEGLGVTGDRRRDDGFIWKIFGESTGVLPV